MLRELERAAREVELVIKAKKTKAMTTVKRPRMMQLYGEDVEYVESFVYLGRIVSFEKSEAEAISRRIRAGWAAFNTYYQFLTNRRVERRLKAKIFQQCIEPAMLYGVETMNIKKKELERLGVAQRKMMRRMLGVTLLDRRRNDWLMQVLQIPDIRSRAIRRKWNWARKISMMTDDRWTKKVNEWYPMTRKRRAGRPKTRWRDEFVENTQNTNWSLIARTDPHAWLSALNGRIQNAISR